MKPRNYVVLAMIKSQKSQIVHGKSKKVVRQENKIILKKKLKDLDNIDIYK